jgi:NAD(P)-dependent dehydrogenase (short-subunit alcohol dehydrogenase family)
LDLSDPESVDSFAGRFVAHGEPLDLLINNAGIMATPLARDAQGHEMQLSTNYLGHFRLTARLWPRLVQAGGARIVMLTSGAHRFSAVDLEDPDYRHRPYEKWQAYGQSKTAAALFALELDARGAAFGVRAFSVHPGSIQTGLSGHLAKEDFMAIGALDEDGQLKQDFAELSKTIEQGAATSVWCATSPQLIGLGGVYCEDCDIANQIPADSSSLHGVLPWACDAEQARAWWSVSERLVGLEFSPSAGETAH